MLDILIAVCLGILIAFLFARYLLGSPNQGEKTFGAYLKKFGLSGSFAVGGPIVAYFTFRGHPNSDVSILTYLLTFLVMTLVLIVFVFVLVSGCVSRQSVPRSALRPHSFQLLVALLLGGYPDFKATLSRLEDLADISRKTGMSANELHQGLYGEQTQFRERLSAEYDGSDENLRLIRDTLKCSERQLKQFYDAVRRFYKI